MWRFAAILIVGGAVLGTTLGYLEWYEARTQERLMVSQDRLRLSLPRLASRQEIREFANDLRRILNSERLRDYVQVPSAAQRRGLEDRMIRVAEAEEDYFQRRFIGTDGYERVRVNYEHGTAQAVPPARLQDKAGR